MAFLPLKPQPLKPNLCRNNTLTNLGGFLESWNTAVRTLTFHSFEAAQVEEMSTAPLPLQVLGQGREGRTLPVGNANDHRIR